MRLSLPLMVSPAMTIGLTAAAIVVILFAANFTITNAQQQTSQPAAIQNGTLFQNAEDGFRVQVPEGWVIHDMENTGFALFSEMLQGYGILAQLCSEEQQQQALRNVGSGTLSSCEGSEGDVIYIVRYPNVGPRLASGDITTITNDTINDILAYQIQKLQEVGYTDIKILNSTDTTVNIDISTEAGISNNNDNTVPAATVPAKLVEITYSTNFAPNEIRTGQFILTATDAHNLGEITAYSIFYEGAASAATAAAGEETTTPSGSLPSSPTTTAVIQVFDSFELVVAAEVTQATAEAQAEQTNQPNSERTNDDDDGDGDENGDGGGSSNDEGTVVGRPQDEASDHYDGDDCDACDENSDENGDGGSSNDDARVQGRGASGPADDYG
jgi:hypothetical protein